MQYETLFKTIHGSRLYGLAHADSDYDYFTVVAKPAKNRKARLATHSIVDGLDSNVLDLGTFLDGCVKGVPQYLEAMFSPSPEIDKIAALRAGYRVGTSVYSRYLSTIKTFAFNEKYPYKCKRHALRLALNMRDMRAAGRFNPTLDRVQVALVSSLAELDAANVYNDALAIAWA